MGADPRDGAPRGGPVSQNFQAFEAHGKIIARPALHILQEAFRSGLWTRIVEEVAAVHCGKLTQGDVGLHPPGGKLFVTGVLLVDGALGYFPGGRTETVFSLVLGVQTAGERIRSGITPAQNMAQAVLRCRRGVINFDGAETGRAGCAAMLSKWEIPRSK